MALETEEQQNVTPVPVARRRLEWLRASAALAAWHYAPFRRFFGAQSLAMAGRALQMTLIGYIVYEVSDSKFLLGLVSFMQMVPQLILAPLVGVVVDRFDRRWILAGFLTVQAAGLLLLSILSAAGMLTVPMIAGTVIVMGIGSAFSYPASSSLLPSLVPMNKLQSANAINSMMGNVSRIAAPAASGLIVDTSGVTAALLLGSGIYVPAAVIVLSVPLLSGFARISTGRGTLDTAARPSVLNDITDAIAYIRSNAMLRAALVNDIAPYLFGLSHIALLPVIASETLGGGASTLGLLYGVGGAGAVLGTLAAGVLSGRQFRGPTIWLSMIGFGLGLLIVAAGRDWPVIATGLFISGLFQMLYIIQNDTLVQTFAEDRYRGRAVAAQSMVNGLMPIGFLFLGTIAELTSVSFAFVVSALALIGMGIGTALFRPAIRDFR